MKEDTGLENKGTPDAEDLKLELSTLMQPSGSAFQRSAVYSRSMTTTYRQKWDFTDHVAWS